VIGKFFAIGIKIINKNPKRSLCNDLGSSSFIVPAVEFLGLANIFSPFSSRSSFNLANASIP